MNNLQIHIIQSISDFQTSLLFFETEIFPKLNLTSTNQKTNMMRNKKNRKPLHEIPQFNVKVGFGLHFPHYLDESTQTQGDVTIGSRCAWLERDLCRRAVFCRWLILFSHQFRAAVSSLVKLLPVSGTTTAGNVTKATGVCARDWSTYIHTREAH